MIDGCVGIGITREPCYWVLGGLLGIVLTLFMCYCVHTDSGKSWNLKFKFSNPEKSWNQAYDLESHG